MQIREHSTLTASSDQLGIGDKLAFLSCYSRYYLSVTAENHGQLSELLSVELEGVVQICRLHGEELGKHSVSLLVANGFGLRQSAAGGGGELEALDELVKSSAIRPLVLIEDAPLLSEGKLRQLLVLADRIGLGLAMFGSASLGRRKACAQFENRILHTTVPKLSQNDVRHLVRRQSEPETQLSEAEIDNLIQRSGGRLDKLDSILEDVIETPARRIGLPLVHMSALIVLAIVIVGGWLSINEGESTTTVVAVEISESEPAIPSISTRGLRRDSVNAPEKSSEESIDRNAQRDSSELSLSELASSADVREEIQQVITDRDDGILNTAVSIAEIQPRQVEASSTPVSNVTKPQVAEVASPIVLKNSDPNAWINELPPTAAGRVSQNRWLQNAPDAAYTLQLMGSHSEARVLAFIAEQGNGSEFGYFKVKHRNQPWFVLTVGQYPDRDRALQAIDQLPPSLQAQKPWARNVASIRGN